MDEQNKRTMMQHWPVIALGIAVAIIFISALVLFQVRETEDAIVIRFGSPVLNEQGEVKKYEPGLHVKWPAPIEKVWRHDNRLQVFELSKGQVQQAQTADNAQIIVTTYVLWEVGDPAKFRIKVNTTKNAHRRLNDIVGSSRKNVIGAYSLGDMINVEADKVKLAEIEDKILQSVQARAQENFGIHVKSIGIKHLGFPEKVSEAVFQRMIRERETIAANYRSKGTVEATKIKTEADLKASDILARAEGQAQEIRAEGDQIAAESYAAFRANPELAVFLRKLDSLRKTLAEKTTLVVDTTTPPYDLLAPGAINLGKEGLGSSTQEPVEEAKSEE